MEILHCMLKKEYEKIKELVFYGEDLIRKDGFLHCSTWNSFYEVAPAFMNDEEEKVLLCMDGEKVQAEIKWEDFDGNGILFPHIYGLLNMDSVLAVYPFVYQNGIWHRTPCTNILMNISEVDADWCFPTLSKYINKMDRVCVVAFSFWKDTLTREDWNKQYHKEYGMWYHANTDVWKRYGIVEEQVVWINYFEDTIETAKNKILNSSVVFFTGGAPDLMMDRIKEFDLQDILKRYQGVLIGYSAGAMIQLKDYHITPDCDYPVFSYEEGLGMVAGFDIEVHYERSNMQKKCMEKVGKEKQVPLYAMYDDGGLIVQQKELHPFGHVETFENKGEK